MRCPFDTTKQTQSDEKRAFVRFRNFIDLFPLSRVLKYDSHIAACVELWVAVRQASPPLTAS